MRTFASTTGSSSGFNRPRPLLVDQVSPRPAGFDLGCPFMAPVPSPASFERAKRSAERRRQPPCRFSFLTNSPHVTPAVGFQDSSQPLPLFLKADNSYVRNSLGPVYRNSAPRTVILLQGLQQ